MRGAPAVAENENTAQVARAWRLTIGQSATDVCYPEAVAREVVTADYPQAERIVLLSDCVNYSANGRVTTGERRVIRDWLASIGETDGAVIDEVLKQCKADQSVRDRFVRRMAADRLRRQTIFAGET